MAVRELQRLKLWMYHLHIPPMLLGSVFLFQGPTVSFTPQAED